MLSPNAEIVLQARYLLRNDQRKIVETPDDLFHRVARHVGQGERNYPSRITPSFAEEQFYQMMRSLEFLPNSPTLMNAGTPLGQLSACFVLPIEDSLEEIFESLRQMAKIHQTGGGTGFSFSRLRPRGDLVATTKGLASGPVSFMKIFDAATDVILQGGRRRGANMGILRCDHPDIEKFIRAKEDGVTLSNFNISVAVTDNFMAAVRAKTGFSLLSPKTRKVVRRVPAAEIFDRIVRSAWKTGDPGLIFIDEIKRRNPTPRLGPIEATNPCGELPLLPFESCNLASINLAKMVNGRDIDWKRLREKIHWGIRFLDDVIEVSQFPLPQIKAMTMGNRKVGLGVMGFADLLIQLRISYGSQKAVDVAGVLMRFIRRESLAASVSLARERGCFPNFRKSVYSRKNLRLRNATFNAIAPTGTISIIAGCSSGIEPLFALRFVRNVLSGKQLVETNPLFEAMAEANGFWGKGFLKNRTDIKSLRHVRGIPAEIRRLFMTGFDLTPRQHLAIQAAFQRFVDNAVSKTVNLPKDATPQDVGNIYLLAHRLRCKGITVYRYASKADQVLSFDNLRKTTR